MKLLIFGLILLFSLNSLATYIIPDTKRVLRFKHSTGAATGWSLRKNINGSFVSYADEDLDDGEEKAIATTGINLFYNFSEVASLELYYSGSSYEDKDATPLEYDYSRTGFTFGVPILDIISIGASHSSYEDDSASQGDNQNTAYSASIKILQKFFVGFGKDDYEDNNNGNNNYDTDLIGVGFVIGDRAMPFIAGEVYLRESDRPNAEVKTRGSELWMNLGNSQPFLSTSSIDTDSTTTDSFYRIVYVGLDQTIGNFYVIPAFKRTRFELGTNTGVVRAYELEVGYRVPRWQAFAKYIGDRDDYQGTLVEEKSTTLEVGALFNF